MKLHTVSSDRLRIKFATRPFAIKEIRDLQTGSIYSSGGTQILIIRSPLELFEPTLLTNLRSISGNRHGLSMVLTDDSGTSSARLFITSSPDGLKFNCSVSAAKPVWMLEWRISGLNLEKVIIPALGGQVLTSSMPAETTLSYKYPFWWNAQFVIGTAKKGGIWIRTKDPGPNLKMLRVRKDKEGFAITYGFEATAPVRSKKFEAEWFVDGFQGSWSGPAGIHRRWMERAFGLTPFIRNPGIPSWMRNINFVLEMWGITKDRPEPLHTFEEMTRRLREFRKLHDPDKTLVYVPGFAMHGIDSRAPDYFPSKHLGGDRGFAKFVKRAHEMGYRVMIHTNVLAMTFTHRLYPKFKKHQVVDVFGREMGWGLDMDGDWLAEPYFAYINPGVKAWGALMEKTIGGLIRKFKLDAVFLDQTLLAFNVSRGPNFLSGMREHVERLSRKFPGVLFAGEGLHEQVIGALPVAQIHGIDSIAEVHAMDGITPWRQAHPVSAEIFGPYTRFTAHLLTKHPSHPMFRLQEKAYGDLGVIPALVLYHHGQAMDSPATRVMVRRAKKLSAGHS